MTPKLSIAREVAYDAFIEVMEQSKDPTVAVEALYKRLPTPLKKVDRALVKEVLFGSLRWHSKIFWIIQNTSTRDLNKSSPEIRAALILGTYQIFYMDRIPDRAAVNESVEYVKKKGQAHAIKFVNGILRSISRRAEYFAKPDKNKKPVDYLSLQFAHPKWIVERWSQRFNFERLKELLAANNKTPPNSIRMNKLKIPADEVQKFRSELLRQDRNHSDRRSLRSCLHLKNSINFEKESLFQSGYYTIQDESSQLISLLVNPQQDELVIDSCCGPGGKTGHIYELGEEKTRIIAIEKDKSQLEKAQENFKRLGHSQNIRWENIDFLEYKTEKTIDKILIDAPCSGLGVLRRHPEGKWQKSFSIISKMASRQRELLQHGLSLLKIGGEIVYSVCSFEQEETIDQLNWLKTNFGDTIELVSPVSRIPDYYKRFITRDNILLIYSGNKDMMDGFGAFIIKKIK